MIDDQRQCGYQQCQIHGVADQTIRPGGHQYSPGERVGGDVEISNPHGENCPNTQSDPDHLNSQERPIRRKQWTGYSDQEEAGELDGDKKE